MTDRRTLANAIRFLSIDAVQPLTRGIRAPMGMADVAEVLWRQVLRHNPRDPNGRTGIGLCCRMATVPC